MGKEGMRKLMPMAAGLGRARLWKSMRHLRMFTRPDLEATAEVKAHAVAAYVSALIRSGYLLSVSPYQRGVPGGEEKFRLVKNTGPAAPRVLRDGSIFDPNTANPYLQRADKRLLPHANALLKTLRDLVDAQDRGQPLKLDAARQLVATCDQAVRK